MDPKLRGADIFKNGKRRAQLPLNGSRRMANSTGNGEASTSQVKPKLKRGSIKKTSALAELSALVGRSCVQPHDKFNILRERDGILHKSRIVDTNYKTAAAKTGTSEYMCSELEFWTRFDQNRISNDYEIDAETGEPDMNMCIKDYARSSADAENPLPHELRSEECLVKTMRYLFIKIVNNFPENDKAGQTRWYDYIWTRTRSIRKDLMQQGMISLKAAFLFESCARFHIYVSHKLCNLDAHEFDKRLNTEHLSKSMQSVRDCYADLAKMGIYSPNEVEFRCYEILMNLNDPKVFSKAMTYREEVFGDPKLKLVIRFAKEYRNKNYAAFFQLLQSKGSLLECCLAHRFFDNFRSTAVKIIRSAYVGNASTLPISFFTKNLAFDSFGETMKFLTCFNLPMAENDPMSVVITRYDSSESYSIDGIFYQEKWIEAKLDKELASVLLGDDNLRLPWFDMMASSFDAKHVYKNDPVIKEFVDQGALTPQIEEEDDGKTEEADPRIPSPKLKSIDKPEKNFFGMTENVFGKREISPVNMFSGLKSTNTNMFLSNPPTTSIFGGSKNKETSSTFGGKSNIFGGNLFGAKPDDERVPGVKTPLSQNLFGGSVQNKAPNEFDKNPFGIKAFQVPETGFCSESKHRTDQSMSDKTYDELKEKSTGEILKKVTEQAKKSILRETFNKVLQRVGEAKKREIAELQEQLNEAKRKKEIEKVAGQLHESLMSQVKKGLVEQHFEKIKQQTTYVSLLLNSIKQISFLVKKLWKDYGSELVKM
uniref:SAC3_GANP domain-containing protein n=1 Tax=Rhabditophanes sp. KR3021 TaxID=114890 RepID=A0AC35UEY9_9BILA